MKSTDSSLTTVHMPERLSAILAQGISEGRYALGSRLPTEERLAQEFQVNRSVVREAIARLKTDGLVTTRQGLGAFVAKSLAGVPFRLQVNDGRLSAGREIFELRLGVEAQAAVLAAERGTPEQFAEIRAALQDVEAASGSSGVEEDLRFHRSIALATNNQVYSKFVSFLEVHVRDQLGASRSRSDERGLLAQINSEHQSIYDAIAARDPEAARSAVVTHLCNGIGRLTDGPNDK